MFMLKNGPFFIEHLPPSDSEYLRQCFMGFWFNKFLKSLEAIMYITNLDTSNMKP